MTYTSFQLIMSASGSVVAGDDGKDTVQLQALVEQKADKLKESWMRLGVKEEIHNLVAW